jgi:hypothetical protein
MTYEATANELTRRIEKLIPDNPQILELDSPWDLFKVEGFECSDLGPSLYQAGFALAKAKANYKEERNEVCNDTNPQDYE